MSAQKKIISLGDYLKRKDEVEAIELSDCTILIRIRKPSTEDSMKLMELLGQTMTEEDIKAFGDEAKAESQPLEKKLQILRLSYDQSAMLISSCCFYPTLKEDGTAADVQVDNPEKIWESASDVMQLPNELYEKINEKVGARKFVMPEVEAKK
jgi:hypothetical protein